MSTVHSDISPKRIKQAVKNHKAISSINIARIQNSYKDQIFYIVPFFPDPSFPYIRELRNIRPLKSKESKFTRFFKTKPMLLEQSDIPIK